MLPDSTGGGCFALEQATHPGPAAAASSATRYSTHYCVQRYGGCPLHPERSVLDLATPGTITDYLELPFWLKERQRWQHVKPLPSLEPSRSITTRLTQDRDIESCAVRLADRSARPWSRQTPPLRFSTQTPHLNGPPRAVNCLDKCPDLRNCKQNGSARINANSALPSGCHAWTPGALAAGSGI